MKIAILLSTYNGEKFLEQQLNSILNQDFLNWQLFIRDDMSTDNTVQIIRNFTTRYENIQYLESDVNIGAAMSFMSLVANAEADYYLFCDQDDIWLENKLTSLYNKIRTSENKDGLLNPCLVFSDAIITDSELNKINDSFWAYTKCNPADLINNPQYINVFNCAPGCTMIFNKQLKLHLNDYSSDIYMHDWYVMIKALQIGIIDFINEPLVLYRQHSANVIGANEITLQKKILSFFSFSKVLKQQINQYDFVKKFTRINFLYFYYLKLKFNLIRYSK